MKRLLVLISGRGSNMQALVKACRDGEIDAEVVGVISNSPTAKGLDYARDEGIDTFVVDHRDYPNRKDFDGFMRVLGAELVQGFVGRMINIHPSLLPKYPGLDTHERALAANEREHGASVHFVTPELDAGPVIEQVRVPILDTDTSDSLAARVLMEEHPLLVRAMKRVIEGEVQWPGPEIS